MSGQPVTPDREAPDCPPWSNEALDAAHAAYLDLLVSARQQGRDEAAADIEAHRDRVRQRMRRNGASGFSIDAMVTEQDIAARLARGGPNRKDDE